MLLQKSLKKKFGKVCSLNSEIEGLAEDSENNVEIYDHCLQREVNITKKIDTLKSSVDKEKGLIKNSDAKPESFNQKFVNFPKLTIEKLTCDVIHGFICSCNCLMGRSRHIEKVNYLHS